MAVKIYGGTVTNGGTNGTLLSSGDMTAPLLFDGMYPASSDVNRIITIALRANGTETWANVVCVVKGLYKHRFSLSNYSYTSADLKGLGMCLYPIVGNKNKLVDVTCYAGPTDPTGPDVSVKICVVNAIRIS